MKSICAAILLFPLFLHSQANRLAKNRFQNFFGEAYAAHPEIPRGLLEAVSYTNTRFAFPDGTEEEGCTGMPRVFGVMGLIEDGEGWFRDNLALVDTLSAFSKNDIKTDPRKSILAYADAFATVYRAERFVWPDRFGGSASSVALHIETVIAKSLVRLSEMPNRGLQDEFAINSFLYSVFSFMNDENCAAFYGFPGHSLRLQELFGEENLRVLSAHSVRISEGHISDESGNNFRAGGGGDFLSADYGPALWNQAASCNFSSRNGTLITAVTIHTVQGTYAGCISWFQNCNASVSAHYVVRSSDGQITQMVYEADKAWHVGSENPYTIGIEHEGYVNNASWYTTAMYTASAALVRNICADNSIDPVRTGWWPWLANTYYNQSGIPGSCTKVKGHMHFPNQTHNDPGVNWNWDYYYTLINNNPPAAINYSAATGNFYDSGGLAGNYADDERTIWTIAPANAASVTVSFSNFDAEDSWDYLFIYDGADITAPLIGYYTGTNNPGTISSSGGSLTFEFRSDCATTGTGWNASWTSTSSSTNTDIIPPTTTLSASGNWQTADFPVTFTEADNNGGSGLEKSFYQVIDYDGTDWRANNSRGFFSDNFDQAIIHPDWTSATGTWAINNGVLEQNDEALTNTNIYASLDQTLSNKYLYNWSGKIDGTGNNRRAGLHIMCDNASLTNRGNSYFVWFRVDQSVCEFYKVTNDVFSLEYSVPMTVNAGQWYDWKVVYDRITGKLDVYQDNAFIGSWTDSSPISSGNAISFRSGNCNWQVNNLKVYRSRYSNTTLTVTIGNCASCDIRYENSNPSTPAGRVKSIVRDSANNFSAIAWQDINTDWTAPLAISLVNDGDTADIDLSTSATNLGANWSSSSDPNSGLARYYVALGTIPGDSDVIAWTNNWGYDSVSYSNLSLVTNQWYYWSVRAENGAGLMTQNFTSDGVLIDLTTGISAQQNGISISASPNPFGASSTITYTISSAGPVRVLLYDATGRETVLRNESQAAGTFSISLSGENMAPGVYFVRVEFDGKFVSMPLVRE
jgi:hypothetical protein